MKKIHLAHRSFALIWTPNSLALLLQAQQQAVWFATLNIDWTKLPWAVCGAIIGMLKARTDENGQIVHKTFYEWTQYAVLGTIVAMAAWKDLQTLVNKLQNIFELSGDLSAIVAGIVAWIGINWLFKKAKKTADADDKPFSKP